MKKNIGQIAYMLIIVAATFLLLWLIWQINQTILYIILAIMILLVMVTIHEFGHYLAGKILKFKINEFSVGFGPKLVSKKRKNGEVFSIRLFPLGGFCAFEGEMGEDNPSDQVDQPQPFSEFNATDNSTQAVAKQESGVYGNSYGHETPNQIDASKNTKIEQGNSSEQELKRFNDQEPWKRIIVFAAGGVFNLLSAIIFSFIFILAVGYSQPKIAEVFVIPNSSGEYYNQLVEGDILYSIGGTQIGILNNYSDLLDGVALGESIEVTVIRDGAKKEIVIQKQNITTVDSEGNETTYPGFGFKPQQHYANASFGYALKYCVPFTGKLAWSILGAFGGLLRGSVAITELSGPVGTIDAIAEVSALDWRYIFLLLPLIAANLGLFNLFPIPALDGSKIVFATIEWIRKKPINRNIEAYIHLAGMALLLLFVIVIDIIRYVL